MVQTNRTRKRKRKKRRAGVLILIVVILLGAVAWAVWPRLEQQAYPLKYADQIAANASEYGLDPYFVAAVIRTESGFDPDAVSNAGARGLMQLMPETGSWIAEKLDVEDYTDNMLFQPDVSIRFGCWYLDFLEDRFDGQPDIVAAAYNAGHNRVREWLEDEAIAPGGKLTNIPYEETSQYIERVAAAEEKYEKLYPHAFAFGAVS